MNLKEVEKIKVDDIIIDIYHPYSHHDDIIQITKISEVEDKGYTDLNIIFKWYHHDPEITGEMKLSDLFRTYRPLTNNEIKLHKLMKIK